ncbi:MULTISPECIES: NAD(P)H-dependent glycerol-3-phosphate dehydrogenase [Mycolicibacterium]|uniref:Glycerol-3-phosphate dehydrogenase [NAD(P)+] n=4 Tax=Mycolicibacterium fortuitum TaxID=1766 RepID=A0AAE4V8X2_MYCFO|nr:MULTISPECIES: NAD(P)H-dependent glycerol-3-phosphate dehydrogenase [Mycolicibacterium]EJZ14655.1 NAD(P)H-dependent glycerol-3-phosphate dehydrogenase [Mycolicibacterium fortuitum subsp. fortuitum DSM 46621 = ATCC 6841 = JCM 6387]MBP3081796.1 NAD(P)-dependent glycerol-3-phosphate dehydrogenase [Mycolicibacterium fortuitum]MCA4722708.1 NAD(P)-dependent glycerol-3-phosphate dehydrogenase [Mycolicibacterium fortuitum]MCA4751586.1 NAD(P)-dependent glycerol-3-phosphate dehydrogenase [Mycolicibacte
MVDAAVMGAGAWGTALAKVLADAGNPVTMWARRPEVADEINTEHRNSRYLGDVVLPSTIRATADPAEALAGACTVLLGVPAQQLRANLEGWKHLIGDDVTLVSLAKGIELGSLMRMSQVIVQVTGADPSRVAVVTGPNLASEIADGQPAATVVACSDSGRAVALQRALATGYFRPYTNADVVGAEVGGACKNVIALACGMAVGVGLGENTVAAIITRGLAEVMRLGIALGATPATLAGLAGVGDLVATCTSRHSRNRTFGERLGKGGTMESAMIAGGGHVAEGVASCESVLALASSYGVEMPLTDAVYRVCHKGLSVHEAVAGLLGRSTKPE